MLKSFGDRGTRGASAGREPTASGRLLAARGSVGPAYAAGDETVVGRIGRYGGAVVALGLTTAALLPLRDTAGLLNIGLVYLVVIIGVTVFAGRRAGVLSSVLGFLLLDYFLVPPYLTFVIADIHNILALFVFLGVSLLISWLIADAREQARQARLRAEDISRLYELNQAIAGVHRSEEILPAVAQRVCEVFNAERCWALMPDQQQLRVVATFPASADAPTAQEIALAERVFQQGSPIISGEEQQADGQIVMAPLRAAQKITGVLALARKSRAPFAPAEQTVFATFADQAGAALERLYLLGEAERAEMLARTDELKSALMSAVSHDLRTPLASITASVTSLLEQDISWDEETKRDFLQGIYDEAQRLNRLVGNLLDMSRIQGGEIHPEKDWYSIGEVIEAVLQRLEPRLDGHQIKKVVAPDLPLLLLDFTEIDQVLTNLLENAIKYTPPGTLIWVRAGRAEDRVVVSVQDNGPGVPSGELEHLFDMFYRVDKRSESPGTGLGMAIAKGLVEAHGGDIRAENAPGGGLDVTFALPLPTQPHPLVADGSNATTVATGVQAEA